MTENLIQTIDLRKTYKMGETEVHALDGLDLSFPSGSFIVIMGPSGSGKSTLLYLVGGLDWPTSGKILVDGLEIDAMDENALADYRRNKIGFIFQSFNTLYIIINTNNFVPKFHHFLSKRCSKIS